MSVAGIASSILSALNGFSSSPSSSPSSQAPQNKFQQIQSEFQQLGQDLQSGNLTQAQSDFTTLSQNLPGLSQASTANSANGTTGTSSVAQAFAQLGQDLQSGNLSAAQSDFTTLTQDAQTVGQQVRGHHHHHHAESSQASSSSASSSSSSPSSQVNALDQAFSQLAQTLQSGNLQGAQSAFTTLQSDLQQIGGLITSGSSGTAASASSSLLNVLA